MRFRVSNIFAPLMFSILILLSVNIFTTTLFPAVGLDDFNFNINLLMILFIGFAIESPYVPLIILIIQIFQSAFTIEGWALGTFSGVIVCLLISYVKDLLQFTTYFSTVIITQIFLLIWFFISSLIIYMKLGDSSLTWSNLLKFIPESLVLSLIAPFVFTVFKRIWNVKSNEGVGVNF